MSKAAKEAEPVGMTFTLPPVHVPAVTVVQSPPALVTKRNAAHVGMSGEELHRVLRAMRADPRFADQVIARGKSFRAAPPAAIVAYLRAAPISNDLERADGPDDGLLRAAGYEPAPPRSRAGR